MNTSIQLKLLPIAYLLTLISLPISYAAPISGYVSNDPALCKQIAVPDKRCPIKTGKLSVTQIRGFIGIRYEYATGRITYEYPETDLRHFDIHVGDYIVKIEKELYQPCRMTNIVLYPAGFILSLTIRTKEGKIRTIPVKLIPMSNFKQDDS
jgi:hypothetical protein